MEHNRRLLDSNVTTQSSSVGTEFSGTGLRLDTVNHILLRETAQCSFQEHFDFEPTDDVSIEETLQHFAQMTDSVLAANNSLTYFSSNFFLPGDDPGYVKAANETERKAWMAAVKLRIPGWNKPVKADRWLRKQCGDNVSDREIFLFLAYVLPAMVNKAEYIDRANRLAMARSRKPTPQIAEWQKEQLCKQIQQAKKHDDYSDILGCWERARGYLRKFYTPDLTRFDVMKTGKLDVIDALERCLAPFSSAFQDYSRAIASSGTEQENRRIAEFCDEMADYFCSAKSDNLQSLFIDDPLAIYRLARSPVHRNICKMECCGKAIVQIRNSNAATAFPIFDKLLDAERDLYSAIVDICADGCAQLSISFDEDSWRELWECIEQSVRSLSYDYEDLLSVKVLLKSGYAQFRDFFPIIDQWLRNKFSDTHGPFEPALWRAIYNSFSPARRSTEKIEYEKNFLAPYRKLFTSTAPDYDKLKSLLGALAGRFRWNRVTSVPSTEELIKANAMIPHEHRKIDQYQIAKFVEIVRNAVYAGDAENSSETIVEPVKEIRMIMAEWVLLHQICYQTQLQLFEAIDRALERKDYALLR